jgi:hypothetical protein
MSDIRLVDCISVVTNQRNNGKKLRFLFEPVLTEA